METIFATEGCFLVYPFLPLVLGNMLTRNPLLNTVDPASALMESSILGIGSAFEFRVRLFSLLKSTHGWTSPVFFLTITKGETHGEVDGHIPPCLVNFSIALRSSPAKANGILWGGCFTGLESPVSIVCSTKLVHPISNSSLAKTF